MKSTSKLTLALVLLLGTLFASAAMASDAPAVAATASAGSAEGSFLCGLNRSASPQLPASEPAPFLKASLRDCGACSDNECVGRTVGQRCFPLGAGAYPVYTCQNAHVVSCTPQNPQACQCWTGPLP
jgi:hypothetical protein